MAKSKNDRAGYKRREVTAPEYGRSLPGEPDLDSPFFNVPVEHGRLDWRARSSPSKRN